MACMHVGNELYDQALGPHDPHPRRPPTGRTLADIAAPSRARAHPQAELELVPPLEGD